MKNLLLASFITIALVSACNMDPGYTQYSNAPVDIDTCHYPETGIKGQDMDIYAHSIAGNGCWSNLRFVFHKTGDFKYELYAVGDFYSKSGICPEIFVTKDTTITFKPEAAGQYIMTTWVSNFYYYSLDTIDVSE